MSRRELMDDLTPIILVGCVLCMAAVPFLHVANRDATFDWPVTIADTTYVSDDKPYRTGFINRGLRFTDKKTGEQHQIPNDHYKITRVLQAKSE